MVDPATLARTASHLMESAAPSETVIASLLERACDRDYWTGLNPGLSISDSADPGDMEARTLERLEADRLSEKLLRQGYFQAPPLLRDAEVDRMKSAVEAVRAGGWLPAFAFVYDHFWTAVRTPAISALVARYLGLDYRQSSYVWAHHVPSRNGARGWPPHNDSGEATRLTLWIPLTDATVNNGCMYVIPRDCMPESLPSDFRASTPVSASQLRTLLQGTRAIPGNAGSVLGLSHQVLHWSSLSSDAIEPRISFAVEFLAAGTQWAPEDGWLIDAYALPSFAERLRAIGMAILEYRRFEPALIRYAELGRRLSAVSTQNTRGL